ncbi:MAG: Gfo/Idh/MocA family oxidoreductase [Verrucomicrobiota bacterium]
MMNRRTFLGTAAAGALAAPSVLTGADDRKIKLGVIGCGGYGMSDINAAFKVGGVEVLAICDVDAQHLEETAAKLEKLQGTRPKLFKQYEQLLETPGLEAVIIATPPHWHALPFIAALERKLDIYCEKPLAYDVREGRAMVDAAKKRKAQVIQIGFQRRQSQAIQAAKQYIDEGKAGKIIAVEAQIHYTAGLRDTVVQDPPASLDWDLWCGPAPKLPYCPQIGHVAWRLEKEYGNGHLVDWGIHLVDATRMVLGETVPRTLQATGGIYYHKGKITTPDILTAHFEFARCPVTWRHHIWGAAEYAPEVENGIFFFGEQETVFATDAKWIVVSKDKKAERKVNEVKTDMGLKHMANFLESVRSRQAPVCQPEDAYHSAATVQLAMVSYQAGARITWDAATEQVLNNPAAAALVKREYRAPYRHPWRG